MEVQLKLKITDLAATLSEINSSLALGRNPALVTSFLTEIRNNVDDYVKITQGVLQYLKKYTDVANIDLKSNLKFDLGVSSGYISNDLYYDANSVLVAVSGSVKTVTAAEASKCETVEDIVEMI